MSPRCPVCATPSSLLYAGTTTARDYFRRGHAYAVAAGRQQERLPVHRCPACGHGFTAIDFPEEIIVKWYAGYEADHIFLAQETARRRTGYHALRHLAGLVPQPGHLLDIGAGPGLFLSEAVRLGWQVSGIEPSAWAVAHGQNKLALSGLKQGDWQELRHVPSGTFDVITAFDVIEHLVHPVTFLREIHRVLRPDGVLVMTTPRFDSLLARFTGRHWHCIIPAHLHYFTRRSLTKAMSAAGFKILESRSHTRYLGTYYFWRRLLDYLHLKRLQNRTVAMSRIAIPINFHDEFELYARKSG